MKRHCAFTTAHRLPPALPRPLRFSPSRLGRSRNRSSPGSTPPNLGLLNSFASPSHPLCDPSPDSSKSLRDQLPLPFPIARLLGRFLRCSGAFDPGPSCSRRSTNGSPSSSTHPPLPPPVLWCFRCFRGYRFIQPANPGLHSIPLGGFECVPGCPLLSVIVVSWPGSQVRHSSLYLLLATTKLKTNR